MAEDGFPGGTEGGGQCQTGFHRGLTGAEPGFDTIPEPTKPGPALQPQPRAVLRMTRWIPGCRYEIFMCRDRRRGSHTHSGAVQVTAEGFKLCLQPLPWQRGEIQVRQERSCPGERRGMPGDSRAGTEQGFSSVSPIHPGESKALSQGGSVRSRGELSHLLSLGHSSSTCCSQPAWKTGRCWGAPSPLPDSTKIKGITPPGG